MDQRTKNKDRRIVSNEVHNTFSNPMAIGSIAIDPLLAGCSFLSSTNRQIATLTSRLPLKEVPSAAKGQLRDDIFFLGIGIGNQVKDQAIS